MMERHNDDVHEGPSSIQVEENGVKKSVRRILNIISGATIADNPATGKTDITISGGGGGSAHTIHDEGGTALTQRARLNFTGDSVVATDDAGTPETDVAINHLATAVHSVDQPPEAHTVTGAKHTVSGGTSGHVLRQTGATTFAWGALQDGDVPAAIARDTEVTTAVTNHEAAGDPHSVYALDSDLSTHAGAADPHTGYQKESEKGAASGYASLDGSGKVPDSEIPAAIARDTEVATAVSDHAALSDPHTGYQKESEKGAASGYASLDAGTKVPTAELGTGAASGSTFLRGDRSWAAPTASIALTIVEKDLGSLPLYGGTFDITGSGLTAGKPVLITQAAGPYTGKGNREDEAEMDLVKSTGYVVDTTTIRCYWESNQGPMAGNVKFQYLVGA